MKTVSVIIPCYNQGHLLGEAVDSVLAQTYSDFEIIVVDDGSTDCTPNVAAKYGDRICYIRKTNAGASVARNLALDRSKGKLVALLDADDRWLPKKLEVQVPYFDKDKDLALCFSGFYFFGSSFPQPLEVKMPDNQVLDIHDILLRTWDMQVPTAIFRRDVLNSVGHFNLGYDPCEDWDMWVRIGLHHKVAMCGYTLSEYRVSEGSLSSSSNARRMYAARLKIHDSYKNIHHNCLLCKKASEKMMYDARANYYSQLRMQSAALKSKKHFVKAIKTDVEALCSFPEALMRWPKYLLKRDTHA